MLGQLGNRVQHALRAFTPRDQKAVKAAADTLRANPAFDAVAAITELGVGEALVSFLDEQGRPTVVERAFVLPPSSRIGPMTADERRAAINNSLLAGHYEKTVDRDSAFEKLSAKANEKVGVGKTANNGVQDVNRDADGAQPSGGGLLGTLGDMFGGGSRRQGVLEAAVKSAARTMGSQVGREIIRGVLGSILGGRRR